MLAADHVPQVFVREHARNRFLQRVRADLAGASPSDVDAAIRRMLDHGGLRFGLPSWKERRGVWSERRVWFVELIAMTCPREPFVPADCVGRSWGPRRVAFLLGCNASPWLGDYWRVTTVLTWSAPRITIDVLPA